VRGGLNVAGGNLSATIAETSRILGISVHDLSLNVVAVPTGPIAQSQPFPVKGGVLVVHVSGSIRVTTAGLYRIAVRLFSADANLEGPSLPSPFDERFFFFVGAGGTGFDVIPTFFWKTKATVKGSLKLTVQPAPVAALNVGGIQLPAGSFGLLNNLIDALVVELPI
jgi:hypothetical protein